MASTEEQVAHVWRRLGFGPAPGDVDAGVAAGGPSAVIEDLLSRPATTLTDWQWPVDKGDGDDATRWVTRMFELSAQTPGQLQERIAWILTGLLVVGPTDFVGYGELKEHQNRLRSWMNAPTYKSLLAEVTASGPMQKYLTNIFSIPPHPNENLARELMELFSLGVTHPVTGAANYAEADIKEIARALTGYLMDWNTLKVYWDQNYWDSGTKSFLGADRGAAKLNDVIAAVAGHDSYRYFVPQRLYTELTGLTPSNATLGELANVWGADGDFKALIAHIARRPEFIADATIGNKIKSPVELITSMLRVLQYGDAEQFSLTWVSFLLRQCPIAPPNVSGWDNRWLHPTQMVLWSNVTYWFCWADDGTAAIAPEKRNATVRRLFAEGTSATGGELALRLAGLHDVTNETRSAVNAYASNLQWTWQRACGTMQLVLDSPEFMVN